MHDLLMKQATVVRLALALGVCAAPFPVADAQGTLPPPLTEREVLDKSQGRVDTHAQRSIVRLSHGTKEQRFVSRFLLRSIGAGALEGVYIVNQGVPALRARRAGTSWWTLLQGRPARCWQEPAGEKPIIIVGQQTAKQPQQLDVALVDAYRDCRFREVDVVVLKVSDGVVSPCSEASVTPSSKAKEVAFDPPCYTTEQGVCHFSLPPAMYGFRVTCDSQATTPQVIFRAITSGQGVQVERFSF